MSDPGSARPDLCSIRTADEQDEIAEAARSGFSAVGYLLGEDYRPVASTSGIDRAIRLSTAAAVLAVAASRRISPTGMPTLSSGHTARAGSPPS